MSPRGGKRFGTHFTRTAGNTVCADFLPLHKFVPDDDGACRHDAATLAAPRPASRPVLPTDG